MDTNYSPSAGRSDLEEPPCGLPGESDTNGHLKAASVHIGRGDLKSCCSSLKSASEAAPQDVKILATLGNVHFQLGEFNEARTQFERTLQLEPQNVLLHVQLAMACQRLGDTEGFGVALKQALELDPRCQEAQALLASFYLQSKRFGEAINVYESLLGRNQNNIDWLLALAKCRFHLGNLRGCCGIYNRVLKLEPGNPIALEALQILKGHGAAAASAESALSGQVLRQSPDGLPVVLPSKPGTVERSKSADDSRSKALIAEAADLCGRATPLNYSELKQYYAAFEAGLDAWITPKLGFSMTVNPYDQVFPLVAKNFESCRGLMAQHAAEVLPFIKSPKLAAIPDQKTDEVTPYWKNDYFHQGDAKLAYAMVARYRPQRIIECGCGNSTKFMRRAARDYQTGTRIICIDPEPRANVHGVADEFHQASTTTIDPAFFDQLETGDFLFVDGSHLVMNGSDCVHLFLNVLPRLKRGVWVHFHDIFLPHDYPYELHVACRYNEQYMLAQLFIYSREWLPALPIYYAYKHKILPQGGGSFWMRRL